MLTSPGLKAWLNQRACVLAEAKYRLKDMKLVLQ
jgi:hypothetical protein